MAKQQNANFGSFADLASVKANTVEKPKNLPDGPVQVIISGPFVEHKAKSGNFAIRFPLKIQQMIDEEAQNVVASDPGYQKALDRDYKIDFWMSPDARWRFTSFCEAMNLDMELDILSLAEALVALGEPFMAIGKSDLNDDGTTGFYNLDSPAPLPA